MDMSQRLWTTLRDPALPQLIDHLYSQPLSCGKLHYSVYHVVAPRDHLLLASFLNWPILQSATPLP